MVVRVRIQPHEAHCQSCGIGYGTTTKPCVLFCPECLADRARKVVVQRQIETALAMLPAKLVPKDGEPVVPDYQTEAQRAALNRQLEQVATPVADETAVKQGIRRSTPYSEHRRASCGVCGERVGHIRVALVSDRSPVIFCCAECLSEYDRACVEDPRGERRAV